MINFICNRILAQFEEFLLTEGGDFSEDSLNYKLWRAVTACLVQKNKDKRDKMALNIQQKFIYSGSEHRVELEGSQLELLDPNREVSSFVLAPAFN